MSHSLRPYGLYPTRLPCPWDIPGKNPGGCWEFLLQGIFPAGSIPGLGRSSGEGKVYPLQYSCLENSTACIVHGVIRSWAQLSDFPFQMDVFESNGNSPSKCTSVSAFSWITNYICARLCPTLFRSHGW